LEKVIIWKDRPYVCYIIIITLLDQNMYNFANTFNPKPEFSKTAKNHLINPSLPMAYIQQGIWFFIQHFHTPLLLVSTVTIRD
jgi:hypothetical protein